MGDIRWDMGVGEASGYLKRTLKNVCRAAMSRMGRSIPIRALYWWSEESADLRAACFLVQRAYSRNRHRHAQDVEREVRLHAECSWPSVGPRI